MAVNMFAGGTPGFYNNQATQTTQFPLSTGFDTTLPTQAPVVAPVTTGACVGSVV